MRITQVTCGLVLLANLIGCDFSPRLSIRDVPSPPSAVSDQGSRTYDWKWSGDHLTVKRPSPLQNVAQISPELVASKFPTDDAVAYDTLPREDWMTEDIYRALQLVLEKPRESVTRLTASIPFGKGPIHTCLDSQGKRLAISADKFRIWNVDSGKIELEQESIPDCVGLSFDQSGEYCYVATTNEILRISVANGETISKWSVLGGLVRFCKARDTDWFVGSNRSGALYLLDRSLKVQVSWTFDKINPEHLSISPQGDLVVTSTAEYPLRLKVEGKEFKAEVINVLGADAQKLFPLVGDQAVYWMDDHTMFALDHSRTTNITGNPYSPTQFNVGFSLIPVTYLRQTIPLRSDKRFWVTIAGEVLRENGELSVFVQDLDLETKTFSKRTNLGTTRPKGIALSQDASRIALVYPNEVQVIERRPLEDVFGDIVLDSIMAKEIDLPLIDKLATYLRKHRLIRNRLFGEQIYGMFVSETADAILRRREKFRRQPAKRIQDDQWLEGDSLFAQSVSFMVDVLQVERAIRQQSLNDTSEQDLQGIVRQLEQKKEKLFEHEDSPAIILSAFANIRMQFGAELDEVSGYAQRMLERYPFSLSVHINIGLYLARKGGWDQKGIGPYFESVANLMPEQEKSTVFAKMYLQFLNRNNQFDSFTDTQFDPQIFDAVRKSWDRFFFHPQEVYRFHFFHQEKEQDIMNYFYSNYPLLGRVEGGGSNLLIFNLIEYRDRIYEKVEGKRRSSFEGSPLE